MKSSVLAQLAELDRLSLTSLRSRWRKLFGSDPPTYGRRLLIRRLAYRIQELAHGGLSDAAIAQMETLVQNDDPQGNTGHQAPNKPVRMKRGNSPPGTRLIREFREKHYEVVVGEKGFEFEGRRYRSLSAIAREITGTQWNGPAFFGLREGKSKEAAR